MRLVLLLAVAALILGGCSKDNPYKSRKATPTATPDEVQLKDVLASEEDLPGCKLDREAETVINTWSRSFNCGPGGTSDLRLTDFVAFGDGSPEDAERNLGNAWSTNDAAGDIIKQTVLARPVIPSSLQYANARDSFGSIGAEQEYVYCATFSDGVNKAVMYFGAFRHKSIRVQWTTFSLNADCGAPSAASQMGRTLATTQLNKLRTKLPGGLIVLTATPTVTPAPTRTR